MVPGRGDRTPADSAAVNAMRIMLKPGERGGTIVIGEVKSTKHRCSTLVKKSVLVAATRSICCDPIEGTRMTAMGQANALAVLAVGDKGCFLRRARYVYGEADQSEPGARRAPFDLNLPLTGGVA
ncbi:fructose-bisphosphatase class II [Shigella flexneri]